MLDRWLALHTNSLHVLKHALSTFIVLLCKVAMSQFGEDDVEERCHCTLFARFLYDLNRGKDHGHPTIYITHWVQDLWAQYFLLKSWVRVKKQFMKIAEKDVQKSGRKSAKEAAKQVLFAASPRQR